MRALVLAALTMLAAPPLALAQAAPASPACGASATPATPQAEGPAGGTAPGGAGSSGFTGGLGGSYIGTVPAEPTSSSNSPQPVTARGLDPIAPPPAASEGRC